MNQRMVLTASLCVSVFGLTTLGSSATLTPTVTVDDTQVNGNCTLREAIIAANTNMATDACPAGQASPAVDVISLGYGTYLLGLPGIHEDGALTGDLDVLEDLRIEGRGAQFTHISGELLDRVLDVHVPAELTIQDLTVRRGNAPPSLTYPIGGDGGGVRCASSLNVIRCVITDNRTEGTIYDGGGGAGISCFPGTLTIVDSEIHSNHLAAGGNGGGVSTGCDFLMEGSKIYSNNYSGLIARGITVIRNSTLENNGWSGIENRGTMTVSGSTISSNSQGGISNSNDLTVETSTISANTNAGGIRSGGILRLRNVTVHGNSAGYGASALYMPYQSSGSSLFISGTLITGDCILEGPTSVVSYGGSLESPGDTCSLDSVTDQVNVADPGVGSLAFHGGPTTTCALTADSPAIDAGFPAFCPPADQRGIPITDGHCDVGSYESGMVFADDFESGSDGYWSSSVDNLAGVFNALLTSRGITGYYAECTFDQVTGNYSYLTQVFNQADGGIGGSPIANLVDLYWKNEEIASTTVPFSGEDADSDGEANGSDADSFLDTVQ